MSCPLSIHRDLMLDTHKPGSLKAGWIVSGSGFWLPVAGYSILDTHKLVGLKVWKPGG
jgi:hypothetical protein